MKSWIPKKISLVSALIAALLSLVLYCIVLFLGTGEIKKIENYYTDTESKYSRVERANAIKSMTEANKKYIETLRGFFVQKGDEVKFIEEIEKIARESGIDFQINGIDVKSNPKEAKDSLKEDVAIRMNIQGSWREAMRFLEMLDKIYFGVAVQNITLDADGTGGWSGALDFIIFREK